MKPEEILKAVIDITYEGSYATWKGVTTVRTLDGLAILSYNDTRITFYVPAYNPNVADHVIAEKYGDYDMAALDAPTLKRILELYLHRKKKAYAKYSRILHLDDK